MPVIHAIAFIGLGVLLSVGAEKCMVVRANLLGLLLMALGFAAFTASYASVVGN